jgi:cyanophycinase
MTRSTLFILGGAIRPDHAAIWQEIIGAAGGTGCRFAVIAAASAQAALKAGRICERLQHYGAQTLTVPLSDEGQLPFSPAIAEDTSWAEAVSTCDGIYLSGGDQGRLHRLLFRGDGTDSAVLTAIRTVYARGGVIAGSAGAAILSQHMLLDAGLSLPALQRD